MTKTGKTKVPGFGIIPAAGNALLRSVAFVAAYLCVATVLADTTWKADVHSGSWTNAANWTDGVPNENISAEIGNSGADYTVTTDSDAMLYATNTYIHNSSGKTTIRRLHSFQERLRCPQ